jgi:hypothetical protein
MIGAPRQPLAIRLPAPHAGQRHVLRHARRFNWLSAGRRWRKTTLAMSIVVEAAIRGGTYIWGAPTYDQVRIGFNEVRRSLGNVAEHNLSRMTTTLPQTGGTIVFRSLDNPDNVRGYTADGVVMDEAAFIKGDAWLEVLRPMLIDTQGWAWGIGTPKGKNWFFTEFHKAIDHDDYMSWQIPTRGAKIENGQLVPNPHPLENPDVPFSEIVQMWRSMPQRVFEQEILGIFHDEIGGVFRRVMDAATAAPQDRGHVGHEYIMGIDWAYSTDFTAVVVLDVGLRSVVHIDRFNGVDYTMQRERIAAIADRFRPRVIVSEANAMGRPNNESLRAMGLEIQDFTTGRANKELIIGDLAGAFERGDIAILPDPVLIGELQAYEGIQQPAGYVKYGAPEGMHDDTVMALAFAWNGATSDAPTVEVNSYAQRNFSTRRPR